MSPPCSEHQHPSISCSYQWQRAHGCTFLRAHCNPPSTPEEINKSKVIQASDTLFSDLNRRNWKKDIIRNNVIHYVDFQFLLISFSGDRNYKSKWKLVDNHYKNRLVNSSFLTFSWNRYHNFQHFDIYPFTQCIVTCNSNSQFSKKLHSLIVFREHFFLKQKSCKFTRGRDQYRRYAPMETY